MSYLSKEARRAQILHGAIEFFAEEGLSGQTRELSVRLGITQPLIYRYFPSKQHLLDAIFEELFVKRWDLSWKHLMTDSALPLEDRIARFYRDFDQAILSREWVRLFVLSGLGGFKYNQMVFKRLMRDVFPRSASKYASATATRQPRRRRSRATRSRWSWNSTASFSTTGCASTCTGCR